MTQYDIAELMIICRLTIIIRSIAHSK